MKTSEQIINEIKILVNIHLDEEPDISHIQGQIAALRWVLEDRS